MATLAETSVPYATDAARWAAITQRDRRADGLFCYSVSSTGIYCRPSCPARRARPEHVRFHASAAAAEQAGFRACRRCHPDAPDRPARAAVAVAGACRLIEQAAQPLKLDTLAAAVGLSPDYLHRLFKAATGLTPNDYALACQAGRVRATLSGAATVTDTIYAAGFNAGSRFYARSRTLLGMRPGRYRAQGRGETIRFALGQCSLGAILVAATGRGVCAILLGDEPEELLLDLQDRFAQAELIGADAEFEQWVARVVGFVEAPALGLDLPLDVRGTAFQQRVWRALREVPCGTTTSYAELAARLGIPRSVRAVAGAIAANPIAVAIPCHRVIRSDGTLSGYRWGVERKRQLIEREAEQ